MHDVVRGVGQQIQLTVWPEDFIISPDPIPGGGSTGPGQVAAGDVLIVAALPDPVGTDRGHELVTLLNTTPATIDLDGWGLVDAAGGRNNLDGTIAGGGVVQVTASGALQLGNQGDTVVPLDPSGSSIDQVTYKADRVRPGRTICLAAETTINGTGLRPAARLPRPSTNPLCRPITSRTENLAASRTSPLTPLRRPWMRSLPPAC